MEDLAYHSLETLRGSWWFLGKKRFLTMLSKKYLKNKAFDKDGKYSVLEIGAGTGNYTEVFKNLFPKSKITAIEMEDIAIDYFKKNLPDIPIQHGYLPYKLPVLEEKPDIVFLIDVLEHLREHKESLEVLHSLLNDEGHLVIDVPAFQFLWSDSDEAVHHYRRYSKRRLVNMLEQSGFKVEFAGYYLISLVFPIWFINFFISIFSNGKTTGGSMSYGLGKFSRSNKIINKIVASFIYIEVMISKYIRLPFGNNLIVVAKKLKK